MIPSSAPIQGCRSFFTSNLTYQGEHLTGFILGASFRDKLLFELHSNTEHNLQNHLKISLREYGLQALKYGLSGGVGFGIATILLYVLTEYAGIHSTISAGIAYIANITSKFILHKFWAFQSKDTDAIYKETLKYTAARVVFFTASMSTFWFLVEFAHIHYMYVSILVTTIFAVPNFLVTRWIFVHHKT